MALAALLQPNGDVSDLAKFPPTSIGLFIDQQPNHSNYLIVTETDPKGRAALYKAQCHFLGPSVMAWLFRIEQTLLSLTK